MLRSCAIPENGPQPAIRTQKPLFLRQRGIPRFPSVGVETLGRSPGFDPGPARSQHAMQTTTPRSPSFVGQGGWIRSSGLRLPTPALFQLSYTLLITSDLVAALGISPRTYRLSGDRSVLSYAAVVEALQPSHATPDRCFADRPAPAKPECAVRGVFIPGGNWLREVDSNHYRAH